MMFGKKHRSGIIQILADVVTRPQLVLQPQGYGGKKLLKTGRSDAEIGFQNALEFNEGFIVKTHIIQVGRADARRLQTIFDGAFGEIRIVSLAGKPFFLGRGNDFSVADETRGRVVIKCGNT